MDIIIVSASRFADNRLRDGFTEYEDFIDSAKTKLFEIDDESDKIRFINKLLEKNNEVYNKHKTRCTNPVDCPQNFAHENVTYYLSQELKRLGVRIGKDTFSEEEKLYAESKLDKILQDLNDVKLGQQVIYEDLSKEINELRDLYYLGKKKWYQLLVGKGIEMVSSGIISETVSKQIIHTAKEAIPTLLKY